MDEEEMMSCLTYVGHMLDTLGPGYVAGLLHLHETLMADITTAREELGQQSTWDSEEFQALCGIENDLFELKSEFFLVTNEE